MKKINFGIGALAIAAMLALDGRYLYEGHHALENVNAQATGTDPYLANYYAREGAKNGTLNGYVIVCEQREIDTGDSSFSLHVDVYPPRIGFTYTKNYQTQHHYASYPGGHQTVGPTPEEMKWKKGPCPNGHGSRVRT